MAHLNTPYKFQNNQSIRNQVLGFLRISYTILEFKHVEQFVLCAKTHKIHAIYYSYLV